MKTLGPLRVSPMGMGTWAWGNQFLWGYNQEMDAELQELFNLVVSRGINIFDTADSYGRRSSEPHAFLWKPLFCEPCIQMYHLVQ
jgi:aryl-alcohol dehydrogenase-like predicted oxidoreductase